MDKNPFSIQPGPPIFGYHALQDSLGHDDAVKSGSGRSVSQKDSVKLYLLQTTDDRDDKHNTICFSVNRKAFYRLKKRKGIILLNHEHMLSKLKLVHYKIDCEVNEILSCETNNSVIEGLNQYIKKINPSNHDKTMIEWLTLLLSKVLKIIDRKTIEIIDQLITAGAIVSKEHLEQCPLGSTNDVAIRLLDQYQKQNQGKNMDSLYSSMLDRCFSSPIPIDLVKKLKACGVNIEIQNKHGHTLLHHIAINISQEPSSNAFKELVEAGFNLSIKDEHGRIALHYLANWEPERCEYFLRGPEGHILGVQHEERRAAAQLEERVVAMQCEIIQLIKVKNPNTFSVYDRYGDTPMYIAYQNNNIKIAILLINKENIDHYCSTNIRDSSLLCDAAENLIGNRSFDTRKNPELLVSFIKGLVNLGANINDTVNQTDSPFWLYILIYENVNMDLLEFVLEKLPHNLIDTPSNKTFSSDPTHNKTYKITYEGYTPLMYAVSLFSCNKKMLKKSRILLQYGSDVTVKNTHGQTVLDIAKEKRKEMSDTVAIDKLIREMEAITAQKR